MLTEKLHALPKIHECQPLQVILWFRGDLSDDIIQISQHFKFIIKCCDDSYLNLMGEGSLSQPLWWQYEKGLHFRVCGFKWSGSVSDSTVNSNVSFLKDFARWWWVTYDPCWWVPGGIFPEKKMLYILKLNRAVKRQQSIPVIGQDIIVCQYSTSKEMHRQAAPSEL